MKNQQEALGCGASGLDIQSNNAGHLCLTSLQKQTFAGNDFGDELDKVRSLSRLFREDVAKGLDGLDVEPDDPEPVQTVVG